MNEDKDIKEFMNEQDSVKNAKEVFDDNKTVDLPEAPASITYTIQTGTGFNALFTVRDTSGLNLLSKTPSIEAKFAELGIIPQPKKGYGGAKAERKTVEGVFCPKCGSSAVEGKTKAGKTFHKCATQKYFNGQVQGCDWVDWDPK